MDSIKKIYAGHPALLLALLLIITFIPFLGETLFYSKGEPREAVVALSMLQSGNWILPVSNGCDIPYKPPMFAWLIALFSLAGGGEVTEFTSRLPSAIAMIVMVLSGYFYCRRYRGTSVAMLMALVTMTAFEVHRAATNCRVDMVLTMFMVVGLYRLFDRYERHKSVLDPVALLLLGGAVLTKGPVGAVLPLLVMWIYMLLRGGRFWKATWQCCVVGVASLVLPSLWYIAAYRQGGQVFYDLAMEENFGRFTGTMSYGSHENPWWYNVMTIAAGMLPYTLLMLMSVKTVVDLKGKIYFRGWRERIMKADRWTVFMWMTIIVIFVFYCIPKSKRSVYLLPIYPMLAYETAIYMRYLCHRMPGVVKFYSGLIASLAMVVPILFVLIRVFRPVFGSTSLMVSVVGLESCSLEISGILTLIASVVMGIVTFRAIFRHRDSGAVISRALVATLTIYWSFSAVYQTMSLYGKSNYMLANELRDEGYTVDRPLYGWCDGSMPRFYTIDFYLDDKVSALNVPLDHEIVFLVGKHDFEKWKESFSAKFDYEIVRETGMRSCDIRQDILLVKSWPKTE